MKVDEAYTDYAYNLIKDIEEKFGPRYSSSNAEEKANLYVKEEFSKFCDETHIEKFQTHPNLYPQGIFKVTGVFAGIAFIFIPMVFPLTILSAVFILIGLIILFSELMFMKRWIKFLFRKGISSNVWGIIKPSGDIKFRIIFEGHIDSAKQMRIAEKQGDRSVLPLLLGFLYLFFTLTFSILKFLTQLFMVRNVVLFELWVFQFTIIDFFYFIPWLILYPCFLFVLWGFTGKTVVPGAGDNLSGVAVTTALGKYLSNNRPKNIEVVIASMGSEEIGDRGAKYFVNQHGDLLKESYAYVIDDAGAGNKFYTIEKDFMHRTTYSPEVIERMEVAAELYKKENPDASPYGKRKIPIGSSDACMYVKGGYKASFIVGVQESKSSSKKKLSKPPHWHSVHDTWQNISKKMLKDCFGMALKFVEIVDREYEQTR